MTTKQELQTDALIRTPVNMARSDQWRLVPVVGSGVSMPLGLPNWKQLLQEMSLQAGVELGLHINDEPPDVLEDIRGRMGNTAFISSIQHRLSVPNNCTTTTLQALATAPIRRIVTTNLDFAIEEAFRKAGRNLKPENVGRGYSPEELAVFEGQSNDPVLLKIHGSLERPSTWVLARKEYDEAYVAPGHLKNFFASQVHIPLFIGFGFHDFDVAESLRLAKVMHASKSYTIIHKDEAERLAARLRSAGIIPIGFYNFDQLPEIIDEIFECPMLSVKTFPQWNLRTNQPQQDTPTLFQVGGANIAVPDRIWNSASKLRTVLDILANAFEIQPNESIIDKRQRRTTGQKGAYRDGVIELAHGSDSDCLAVVLQGMAQYPEILIEGLCSSLLKKEEVDQFSFFKVVFESLTNNPTQLHQVESFLQGHIEDLELSYSCRRHIARILALRGLHAGMRIPPITTTIGSLEVPIYPLTRYQVGKLLGRDDLIIEKPIKPYVFESETQINHVVQVLRERTGKFWRLPTEDEWRSFAGLDQYKWPWGDTPPEYRVHAHLGFLNHTREVINQQTAEVGLLPAGKSVTGLFDLIGNVYEVVTLSHQHNQLAGGAWTTNYSPYRPFPVIRPWGSGKGNVGVRPVLDR